jgi:hypothetical protein
VMRMVARILAVEGDSGGLEFDLRMTGYDCST